MHMTKQPPDAAAAATATDATTADAAAAAAEPVEQPAEAGGGEGEQAGAAPPAAAGEQQAQAQTEGQAAEKRPRVALSDAHTLEQLPALAMGCCVALMRPEDAAALGFSEGDDESGVVAAAPVAIACWRGRASINVLVSKQEAAQLAERILEARAKLAGGGAPPAAAEAAAEPIVAEAVAA